MNAIDLPFLPAALWLIASGCMILLMLVIFGYHVYQRGRLRALARDSASMAELAAHKDSLAAEVAEMRQWLAAHRGERLKLEAERHQQELARADMARLEETIAEKKREGQAIMTRMADLDLAFARRRQFHARLEGEIRALEAQREELEPMEKYVQELRLELDQGKMRLAQLAQEEVRAQSLQVQAQLLKREIAELRQALAPLREEREKLRHFVDQARHASAVKNEQLLEQKREMRAYEQQNAELAQKNAELTVAAADAQKRRGELAATLAELDEAVAARQRKGEDLRQAVFAEQTQLDILMQRREEKETEVAALASRKAALERELEKWTAASRANGTTRHRKRRDAPISRGIRRQGPLCVKKRPELSWK